MYVLLYVLTPEGLSDPLKSHTDNIKVLQMMYVFLIAASFIAGIVFSSVASTDDSNYDSDDEDDGDLVSHIVIYDEMLKTGLETIGYSKNQIEKASKQQKTKKKEEDSLWVTAPQRRLILRMKIKTMLLLLLLLFALVVFNLR